MTWGMGIPGRRRAILLRAMGYSLSLVETGFDQGGSGNMKRLIFTMVAIVAAFAVATAGAQDKKTRISIGTGGTGGVYYPLGGGIAALLSKYVPGVDATAEV